MNSLILENYEIDRVELAVSDTTSETLTDVIDMQGYDDLLYIVTLGDVDAAAVMTFQPKENTASSTSSPTPTAVTLDTVSDSVSGSVSTGALVITESSGNLDNKTILIEVKGAGISARYHFLSITATVESYEVVSIIAVKGGARNVPVTQNSDVVSVAYLAE